MSQFLLLIHFMQICKLIKTFLKSSKINNRNFEKRRQQNLDTKSTKMLTVKVSVSTRKVTVFCFYEFSCREHFWNISDGESCLSAITSFSYSLKVSCRERERDLQILTTIFRNFGLRFHMSPFAPPRARYSLS